MKGYKNLSMALGTTLIVVALLFPAVCAQGRTWGKLHWQVTDREGNAIAEYVQILTLDGNPSPQIERDLLQLASGERLVFRRKTHSEEAWAQASLERLDGEVILATEWFENGPNRVTLCRETLEFEDDSQEALESKSSREQARAAYAKCSKKNRAVLREIAELGLMLDPTFNDIASTLQSLLFPDMPNTLGDGGNRTVVSKVHPFDPGQTQPSAFEQTFGEAYSQQPG